MNQYRFQTLEGAFLCACAYARAQHVSAWLTDNWFEFMEVVNFHVGEPAQARKMSLWPEQRPQSE